MMAIQVGIAPDSWGVWFPKHEKQPSWDRCLDEMAEAGYAGVELGPWGYFPNTASVLRQELDKRNLVLVAGTIGGNFLDEDSVQAMLKTVDEMAPVLQCFAQAKYIVMLPPMYTVFCQADFPIFVVGIPHRHRGKIPTFSGPCQEAGSTTASCRMRACSIR